MSEIVVKIKLEDRDTEETISILKQILETILNCKDAHIQSIFFTNIQFSIKDKLKNA
jgi:hypothetical protein